MTVFEGKNLRITLQSQGKLLRQPGSVETRLFQNSPGKGCTWTDIILRGQGYCIWPNREGEGFPLKEVYPVMKGLGLLETGISLSWPATASAAAIAVFPEEGTDWLIKNQTEKEGYHREIRIFADSPDQIRFRITGPGGQWTATAVTDRWQSSVSSSLSGIPLQYQLGLIGPEGECSLSREEGFAGLLPLGRFLAKQISSPGEKPVLHFFGYGEGHDKGYPDYTPSPRLGGKTALQETARKLKEMGFRLSFYMNARLMDREVLTRFPHLKEAICSDQDGQPVCEEYFGRTFYVMHPGSLPWQKELLKQARMLQDLGADMIQLDQVAGRAATVPPGTPWGEGYNRLIRAIRKDGMDVWIQGVSNYYEADCFEMTWRDLNILPGGILRGGNPFGETDLTLLKLLAFKGTLLCPLSKLKQCGGGDFSFRMDVIGEKGSLPLYGPEYLKELKSKEK